MEAGSTTQGNSITYSIILKLYHYFLLKPIGYASAGRFDPIQDENSYYGDLGILILMRNLFLFGVYNLFT